MSPAYRLIIGLLLTSLVSCNEAPKERKIFVYTSVPSAIMSDVEAAFEKDYPDINMSIYRNGTEAIASKIAAEREAGNLSADVLWVADPSYFIQLKAENMLFAFQSKEKEAISPFLRDPDDCFYAARIITTGIAYNTNMVTRDEVPKYWNDLWNENLKGKVIIANPLYSGMAVLTVGTLAHKYNWDYFTSMRNNGATVVQSNNTVAKKIAMGEFPIGITIDYIVTMMRESGSPIDLVYPEDGVITIPSPIGILKTSKNAEDSKIFVDYILSKKGQEMLVKSGAFTSVRSDVTPREGTPGRDEILARAIPTDWSTDRGQLDDVKKRFSAIMLYWEDE